MSAWYPPKLEIRFELHRHFQILGENAMSLAYRDAVLAKSPVAYWRLGEAAGPTAVDETGNGHDGIYINNPTFGQTGAIRGDSNTAVQFNGMNYVEIPDSADFSQPTSSNGLTVEAWMRPDALAFSGQLSSDPTVNPYVHWLGKGGTGQEEWAFRFYSSEPGQAAGARPNRISAYIWSPAGKEGAGAYFQEVVAIGVWIHVVACYEPGDKNTCPPAGVHIYLDGVQQQGPTEIGTLYCNPCFAVLPTHGTAPLRLATRDLASFLVGGLDEVAIYPRVLRPDEILSNYKLGVS
jgi:concanavalin A-like lectin/glucanase superfamily protein